MTRAWTRTTWLSVAMLALVGQLLVAAPASVGAAGVFPDGTFEAGLDGFVGADATRVYLSRDGAGRDGSRAMVVRTGVEGTARTHSTRRFAGSHRAGAAYVVRAWVDTTVTRRVALRVREVKNGRVIHTRTARPEVPADGWHRIRVRIQARRDDSKLLVAIRAPRFRAADRLKVDDLSIARAGCRAPASGGTTAGTLTNGCAHSARGIPSRGVFVGAAHGSNSDPSGLERALGDRLGVRRTYYTADGVSGAVSTAREDLAKGRLPWLSFKLPRSWSDMVAGEGDDWARGLARRLAGLDGPVWVAFHHEPEGDGDIQLWRRMQERLAPIVRRAAPNVAFTVIVTGWHQFYGDDEYSLDRIWPRDTKIDVAGFDIYQQYGVVKDGRTTTSWTDFSAYFDQIARWARAEGVAWGLGETGVTDAAARARPAIIPDTVELMRSYGGVAYSYFDTTLNSVADWTLNPGPKREGFGEAVAAAPRLD